MKYLDLLNQSAEDKSKRNNELVAEEAALNLEAAVFANKKAIAAKNTLIDSLKASPSLNFKAITSAMNEVQLLEREMEQLKALKKELF